MIDDSMHVVFAGGGTGGHLFPGLAVAEQLVDEEPRIRITFAGGGKEFERRHVAAAGFEYLPLRCRPIPRKLNQAFSFVADSVAGYRAAGRFLRDGRVSAVVGLGGYASVPMARAAVRRGVPLVLLEQNAMPGRATRWLAASATLVCIAMRQAREHLRCRCPVRVTGNPIRGRSAGCGDAGLLFPPRRQPGGSIESRPMQVPLTRPDPSDDAPSPLPRSSRRLVVLGGSGGAREINQSVPRALSQLKTQLGGWRILHQSGPRDEATTRELYRTLDLPATVASFVADVPGVLAGSDLAVSRAGGTTLAELAAAGVPAVLVPYPHAADDHQRKNADAYCDTGAAITLDGRELPGPLEGHLAATLADLLADSQRRRQMSAAMHGMARPDAAEDVAELIFRTLSGRPAHAGLPVAA